MHRSLLEHEGASVEPGPALLAKGFRPFFLLAAAFAVAILPLWLLVFFGEARAPRYLDPIHWHAHEMVFGFVVAVVAGFLLTAVGNWTKRETAVGAPLAALAALWLAGRVAMTAPLGLPGAAIAAIDLAFLPALALVLARPLVAARSRRNFVMLAILAALFGANLAVHLDALGFAPGLRERGCVVGVDVVVVLLIVMAGRIFPMFTRNATGVTTIRSVPALDALAVVAMVAVTALDASGASGTSTSIACGAAGFLAAARAARWGTRHTFREPLLWILHVGYAWIPIGLLLRAFAPGSLGVHALTAGAVGALTLGMMARVALGHTGRMLRAPRAAALGFALVTLAALARVVVPLVHVAWYPGALVVSGLAWAAAFSAFLVGYARALVTPRVDGRAG